MIRPAIVDKINCDSCGRGEIRFRAEDDPEQMPYGWIEVVESSNNDVILDNEGNSIALAPVVSHYCPTCK